MEGSTRARPLTVGQAARILSVHPNTLRKWNNKGLIPCCRRHNRRGDRIFRLSDLMKFLEEQRQGLAMQAELLEESFPVGEAAKILNVRIKTLKAWAEKGYIPSKRIGPRRDRRFTVKDLAVFLTGVSTPDALALIQSIRQGKDRLFVTGEAADILCISDNWMRLLADNKEVPCFRIGPRRHRRFLENVLLAYLESNI